MFYRQKILMALLERFDGHLSSIDLQKYLFLYTTICEKEKSYHFVPYKYGCFSFQSYMDKNKLISIGHLKDDDDWVIKDNRNNYGNKLKLGDFKKLLFFKEKYKKLKGKNLIYHVYKYYPYYAVNSEIVNEILTDDELGHVKSIVKKQRNRILATIGYEGESFESYLNKLIKNDIRLLIDVRKNPSSRKYGFSKKTLSSVLNKLGIKYIHMPELGIDSKERKSLRTISDYEKLFVRYNNKNLLKNNLSVNKLYEYFIKNRRIALTCFERDPKMCHRGTLANYINNKFDDIIIEHI